MDIHSPTKFESRYPLARRRLRMAERHSSNVAQSRSQLFLPQASSREKAMKIHQLSGPPSPRLAGALAEFEEPFTYPLGADRFFRISHGADYTLFFRAQGNAA